MQKREVPDASSSLVWKSTLDSLDNQSPHISSSKSSQTCLEAFPSDHNNDDVQTRPVTLLESHSSNMMTGGRNSEAPDNDTPQASITIPTPSSPRMKSALISQASISRHFSEPRTRGELLKNLRLSLNFRPLPTLPALIDYHDSHPKLRSRFSYNFLIELSIRHAQFGSTRWLFDALAHDNLPRDFDTRILEIRFLVRTGRWETAWSQVTGLTPDEALDKPLRNGRLPITREIPVEMWKELLGTTKKGAIRRARRVRWGLDEAGNKIRLPPFEVVDDPAPGTEAYLRRQRLLNCIQPTFEKSAPVRPQLIKYVVSWMLSDGRQSEAMALTKAYLSHLPPLLRDETAAQCMDIVHALLSRIIDDSTSSFNKNRKILQQLLKTHPSLKPSPTTLRLILAPLKRFTNCGTIALNVIKSFRKEWGDQVIDKSVRRKVARLAEKQGRMDIVEKMMRQEVEARTISAAAISQLSPKSEDTRGFRRPPDRELFSRLTFEVGQWSKLRLRVRGRQRRDSQECKPK